MNQQDDTTLIGHHVVCLIDVLGQKQKLSEWPDMPGDGTITPEFLDAVKQTIGTVLNFRDQFIQYFKQLEQCTIQDKLAASPMDLQERYLRYKECNVHIKRFSDSFVFSSRIPNTHGDASVNSLYRILSACCYAMILSLAAKLPVRGAVTIGFGGVLEDDSFYGPALAEAHYLESDIAGYPRVIVSPIVREFLEDGQVYSQDHAIAQAMEQLAKKCRTLICQDIDGCWIVDFLGKGLRDLFNQNENIRKAVKMAHDYVRLQAEKFRENNNAKLALRYHLLQQYVESRLHLWNEKG